MSNYEFRCEIFLAAKCSNVDDIFKCTHALFLCRQGWIFTLSAHKIGKIVPLNIPVEPFIDTIRRKRFDSEMITRSLNVEKNEQSR